MTRSQFLKRRAAILAGMLCAGLIATACAPSTVPQADSEESGQAYSDSSQPPESWPRFEAPAGADNQAIFMEFAGYSSVEELLTHSPLVVLGHAAGIAETRETGPAPRTFGPEVPEFKRVQPEPIIVTILEFEVDEIIRGTSESTTRLLISEVGRLEAPLMKPGVTYLLFLDSFPDDPGVYFASGGEAHSRYAIDGNGIIRSSVGVEEPYAEGGWQLNLLGQRLDDVKPLLK